MANAWVVIVKYKNGNNCAYGPKTSAESSPFARIMRESADVESVQELPLYGETSDWEAGRTAREGSKDYRT